MDNKEQIVYKKVSELRNNPNNPRKNDEAVKDVAKSIEKYGFRNPLIIDEQGVVWCGNTRLKASKKLGLKEIPCIVVSDLTEQQMKELSLLDNKTNEIAEWDNDMLQEILKDCDFSDFDIDWNLEDITPEEEKEVVEDNFEPEPPEEPKAKYGDIYQLGRHRLMCGDSTKIEDVEKLVGGAQMDMVFADPPYSYNYKSNHNDKFSVLMNDDTMLDFFKPVKEICKGFIWCCTSWKVYIQWAELFSKYFDITNVIIWSKGGGSMGDLYKTFADDYEMIMVSNNGTNIVGKRIGSVWDFANQELLSMKKQELLSILMEMKKYSSVWQEKKDNGTEYMHPTQKPIALSARAIRSCADDNAKIYDVFGGSGSTLMACEQINRNCYTMELDPKYVDVIINRWELFTGEKAVKLN